MAEVHKDSQLQIGRFQIILELRSMLIGQSCNGF